MPEHLAQPSEVQDRWVFDSRCPEVEQIQATIEDAELLVRNQFRDLDTRLAATGDDAEPLLAGHLRHVVIQMVLRYLKNPDDTTQRTIGDRSTAVRVSGRSGLYLADDELALLTPDIDDGGTAAAFSIDTTPADSIVRTWAEDAKNPLLGAVVNSDDYPGRDACW